MSITQDGHGDMGASILVPGQALRRHGHGPAPPYSSWPGKPKKNKKKRPHSHSPHKHHVSSFFSSSASSASSPPSSPVLQTRIVPVATHSPHSEASSCYSTTEDDAEKEAYCYEQHGPETPTPMSREQRSQAYTPLSVPSPLFSTGYRKKRKHSVADGLAETTGPKTPPLSPALRHKHALFPSTSFGRDRRLQAREMASAAHIRGNVPTAAGEQGQTTATPPLESISTLDPTITTRHASSSARSNISGGTVASRHSVFSTPGRDELERKKALVEIDEGPFARAATVQDLNARRRQIHTRNDEEQDYDGKGEKKGRIKGCGLGGRCCVM